jgi:hypothetical protein
MKRSKAFLLRRINEALPACNNIGRNFIVSPNFCCRKKKLRVKKSWSCSESFRINSPFSPPMAGWPQKRITPSGDFLGVFMVREGV